MSSLEVDNVGLGVIVIGLVALLAPRVLSWWRIPKGISEINFTACALVNTTPLCRSMPSPGPSEKTHRRESL
jgi:hypothetical protein